jgi:hypothetical protein
MKFTPSHVQANTLDPSWQVAEIFFDNIDNDIDQAWNQASFRDATREKAIRPWRSPHSFLQETRASWGQRVRTSIGGTVKVTMSIPASSSRGALGQLFVAGKSIGHTV